MVVSAPEIDDRIYQHVTICRKRRHVLSYPEVAGNFCRQCQKRRPAGEVERLKERIDLRLNNHLVEMKEGYDDSITGFNEAWDIVRAVFGEHTNGR